MRTWTMSARVVLAWSILSITLVAIGMTGSVSPAQANTRTARSTELTLTSTQTPAARFVTAVAPATRYVVQDGDTLSGIAARLAVHGGWPTLYAANLSAIGRDPNRLHPGTVLVLPGQQAQLRYTVAAGDTLSRIAAALRLRGGWRALYAANLPAIGHDPNAIRPGTVLTIPRAVSSATPGAVHQRQPAPSPTPPAAARPHPQPVTRGAPTSAGMPQWLKTVLLGVGALVLAAFLIEPWLSARRRRQQAGVKGPPPGLAGRGRELTFPRPATEKACIVLADHDRLIVTCNKRDDTVYVLRPPGSDPKAILRVARLVLPEGPYGELAKQLGMPGIGSVE